MLRSWDNENNGYANSELGECIIPLKDKSTTGSNGYAYIVDPTTHKVLNIKLKPLRVSLTYKGATIPDPTPQISLVLHKEKLKILLTNQKKFLHEH